MVSWSVLVLVHDVMKCSLIHVSFCTYDEMFRVFTGETTVIEHDGPGTPNTAWWTGISPQTGTRWGDREPQKGQSQISSQSQGQRHGIQSQGQKHGILSQGQRHGSQSQGQKHGIQSQGQRHRIQSQGQRHGIQSQGQRHGIQSQWPQISVGSIKSWISPKSIKF